MSEVMDTLISKVVDCQKACNLCFDACLQEDDVEMMAECIRTDRECADMCGVIINFSHRNSEIFRDLVAVCAKACHICATECEKHAHMAHCRRCAEACRACESACKDFLTA